MKKIKRNPGGKSILYFDKNTEISITKFLTSEDKQEREVIYRQDIAPATQKLLESLIHVYDFKSPVMTSTELVEDGSCFLYESLHKWNPEKGSKAFSYFNVVAKNFLINTTNGHKKKFVRHVFIDDVDSVNNDTNRQLSASEECPSTEDVVINKENIKESVNKVAKIRTYFSDSKDLQILDAIANLFENAEDLDFINKQSVYVYLTEITGLDKKRISKTMSKVRKCYQKI